jgi:hypothetical protein
MGCKASKEEYELEGSMISVTAVQASELDSQTLTTVPTNDKFVSLDPVFSSESRVSQSIDLFSSSSQQSSTVDNTNNTVEDYNNSKVGKTDNTVGNDDSEELQRRTLAISKIQRQARRKKSVREARTEQQWKMFANLDVQDEAEMLHLAVFMQTLIDLVPTSPRSLNGLRSLNAASSETNTVTESISTTAVVESGLREDDSGIESEAAQTTEVVIVSGRKRSKSNIDIPDEYNITSAAITIGMSNCIALVHTFK